MAQINITLNQDEILQLLSQNSNEAFKTLFQESLNSVLKAESSEQLNAEPYERSEKRTDSRNGSRERTLNTRIGTIVLSVPRHRNQPFKTMIFENYSRSEAALVSTMTEMVVNGVSTRKVSKVVETLCGTSFSKSTVSELCKDLDVEVNKFRKRPLTEDYPFLYVDATYFKTRENHRTISKALFVALAINHRGKYEIIGFDTFEKESKDTWFLFLDSLKKRGLKGIQLVTSDSHEGIIYGLSRVFPEVPWQRCQFHFIKNILDKTPKKYQEGLRSELHAMFNSPDLKTAIKKRDAIIEDYCGIAPGAMECLDKGFNDSVTVMAIPESLRRIMRTSNHIERLNKELKRRSNVIGVFPNEASILRLMGAVLIELNEKYETRVSPLFYHPVIREMEENHERLAKIAQEQQLALIA
jgi:transposase-like protein